MNTDTILARLKELRGLKLTIFEYCYHEFVRSAGQAFVISYDALASHAQIPAGSVRTTAKRLKEAGILEIRHLGKGRGALIEIAIPLEVEQAYSRRRVTDTIPTPHPTQVLLVS